MSLTWSLTFGEARPPPAADSPQQDECADRREEDRYYDAGDGVGCSVAASVPVHGLDRAGRGLDVDGDVLPHPVADVVVQHGVVEGPDAAVVKADPDLVVSPDRRAGGLDLVLADNRGVLALVSAPDRRGDADRREQRHEQPDADQPASATPGRRRARPARSGRVHDGDEVAEE